MKLPEKEATLTTVFYADIFAYRLTEDEFQKWLIGRNSSQLPTPGLLLKKKRLKKTNKIKWQIARRLAKWFRLIPTIILTGVTGSLAMDNAKEKDDIDLFFITRRQTLWTSRLLATLVAQLLGVRRRPQDKQVKNKICLNMFMAEDSLKVEKKERDLFSAHEVLQMVPLWEKEGAYLRFLKANQWVKNFLPNAWRIKFKNQKSKIKNFSAFSIFEPLARALQLWYMQSRRTTEVITPGIIRFHPYDARIWIKAELAKRLAPFNIPLDKIFYGR